MPNPDAAANANKGAAQNQGGGAGPQDGAGKTERWTDDLPDDVKEFFGDAESLAAFKEALTKSPDPPESYEVPKGVEIDEAAFKEFSGLAKELGLSQEQVAKLVEYDAGRVAELPDAILQKQREFYKEGLVKLQSEVGKERFAVMESHARAVLRRFGDDETTKWLNETGMGDHPAMVKLLAKIGGGLSEDSFLTGSGDNKGKAPKSHAEVLYGG